MTALVIFDSTYGNTEQVAQAIGQVVGDRVLRAESVDPSSVDGLDLLIVGSPTHGGRPKEEIHGLLKTPLGLDGVHVAAFDTRTATIWNRLLPFGYAAPRIARLLESSGGNIVAPPEGFIVLGTKGPLKDGELERAARWAEGLAT